MNSDRIKEIQEGTAYPESVSVMLALKQVWNECEQEQVKNLTIPDVSQQRELLRAFLDHIDCYSDKQINASYDHLIDGFFEARNCG